MTNRRPLTPPCVRLSNNSKIQSDVDGIFIFDFFNTIFIFVFQMNYMRSPPTRFMPEYYLEYYYLRQKIWENQT